VTASGTQFFSGREFSASTEPAGGAERASGPAPFPGEDSCLPRPFLDPSTELELSVLKARAAFNMCVACLSGPGEAEPEPYLADVSALLFGTWRLLARVDPRSALPAVRFRELMDFSRVELLVPDDPLAIGTGARSGERPMKARLVEAVRETAWLEARCLEATARRLCGTGGLDRLRAAFERLAGPVRPQGGAPARTRSGRLRAAELALACCAMVCEGGFFPDEAEHYLGYILTDGIPQLSERKAEALAMIAEARAGAGDLEGAGNAWERLRALPGRGSTDDMKARALGALTRAAGEKGAVSDAATYCSLLLDMPPSREAGTQVLIAAATLLDGLTGPEHAQTADRLWLAATRADLREENSRRALCRAALGRIRQLASAGDADGAFEAFSFIDSFGFSAASETHGLWAEASVAVFRALSEAGRRPEALAVAFGLERSASPGPRQKRLRDDISACLKAARSLQ
jgi:hypothetical protein